MTILTNGNVGINTSTPSLSLDVSGGSIGISAGNLTLNVNITTAGGTYIFRSRASYCYSKLMIALTSGTPDPNWIVGESYVGVFNPTALSEFSPSYWLECNGVKIVTANTTITTLNVLGGNSTLVDSIPELYASLEIQRIA